MIVKVAQLCLTLCDPMDCMVHGILHARILECVAFSFSRESPQPRGQTQISHITGRLYHLRHKGCPPVNTCPNLMHSSKAFFAMELFQFSSLEKTAPWSWGKKSHLGVLRSEFDLNLSTAYTLSLQSLLFSMQRGMGRPSFFMM